MTKRFTRREFLIAVGGAGVALLVGCKPGGEPVEAEPSLAASRQSPGADQTEAPQGSAEMGMDPRYATPTLSEIVITPVSEFFKTSFGSIPGPVVESEWALRIDGLVENPLTLTLDELKTMPALEMMRTLQCIGNPPGGDQIGNATWKGVRLADLLGRVGIQDEAIRARFYGLDGYSTSVDLEWILDESTLLAYEMNGEPLTMEHGHPLRIMIPGLYGQKMPKWLERIEFIDNVYLGFWESNGWSDIAAVKTNSQIVSPPRLAQLEGGVVIEGIAYAGDQRAITAVEISVEEGDWMAATLVEPPSPAAWTQWYITWTPPGEGVYNVAVRATDDTGFTQPDRGGAGSTGFPDGTDQIHGVAYAVK